MIDLVVIGGGPAGLSAALKAREMGVSNVILIERDFRLGGILNQCIHPGFGVEVFNQELTGPEFSQYYVDLVKQDPGITVKLNTMVLDLNVEHKASDKAVNKKITCVSKEHGIEYIKTSSVIIATGARERTRYGINIPGDRPEGIMTAGTCQRYMNVEGYIPGKNVVILGSGDIGLIMARRMTLEGCTVKGVYELTPYVNGLARNVVQCLNDFVIPLYLKHTVIEIKGDKRLSGVKITEVDENGVLKPKTGQWVDCDTLLLSVGLIPENELLNGAGLELDRLTGGPQVNEGRMTDIPGIFTCGNALQIHDLADDVVIESELTAMAAVKYLTGLSRFKNNVDKTVSVISGDNIRYVVPQKLCFNSNYEYKCKNNSEQTLYFRVVKPIKSGELTLEADNQIILSKQVKNLRPGEMEKLIIKQGIKQKISSMQIEQFKLNLTRWSVM